MHIAYLINQYPKTSHSFIRREIAALEAQSVKVERFSIRRTAELLVDPQDKTELEKTRSILDVGIAGLALATVLAAIRSPLKLCKAASLAVRMGWKSDRGVLRHLVYVAEAAVLLRWLKQAEADHLHAHFGTNSAAVAMFCRMLGGPTYSFTAHGTEAFDNPAMNGTADKTEHAAFVVTVSSYGRAQICRWVDKQDWKKIHVIKCGIKPAALSVETPPVSNNQIVCVARLSPEKGHIILLAAVKKLIKEGYDFRVVLVGSGPLQEELKAMVEEENLSSFIHLAGWADEAEVYESIAKSRALALPSFAEGLPVVIMEAFAMRRPVISTYVAGIPELVENGVNGWLVPAGSKEALVEAMREVLEATPEHLAQMGEAGYERVKQNHDVTVEAGKLADLFKQAIAEEKAEALVDSPSERPVAVDG